MPSVMKVSKFAQFHLKTELFPLTSYMVNDTIEQQMLFVENMDQNVFSCCFQASEEERSDNDNGFKIS